MGETQAQRAARLDDEAWNAQIIATILAQVGNEQSEWPEAAAIAHKWSDTWQARSDRFAEEADKSRSSD